METTEQILEHALDLPDDQRAAIAERLIESLDSDQFADGVAEAWRLEIRRRLDRVLSGKVTGRPWEDVSQDIKVALRDRKS